MSLRGKHRHLSPCCSSPSPPQLGMVDYKAMVRTTCGDRVLGFRPVVQWQLAGKARNHAIRALHGNGTLKTGNAASGFLLATNRAMHVVGDDVLCPPEGQGSLLTADLWRTDKKLRLGIKELSRPMVILPRRWGDAKEVSGIVDLSLLCNCSAIPRTRRIFRRRSGEKSHFVALRCSALTVTRKSSTLPRSFKKVGSFEATKETGS